MSLREDWETPRERGWGLMGEAGMGALRVTLLFGSAAVALALILTPIAETHTERLLYSSNPLGLDMMATGTVRSGAGVGPVGQRGANAYTVRRSVLQPSPNSVCIIRNNGMRTGDC